MFCPNCGKPCRDTDMFCGSCGSKLPQIAKPVVHESKDVTPHAVQTPSTTERVKEQGDGMRTDGAILTNSKALAAKLHTEPIVILKLLSAYVTASEKRGLCYRIIDAAGYTMLNPNYSKKVISLTPADSWEDHISILADYYTFGRSSNKECTCYLFIVGGEDVVPMPVIRHYMAGQRNFSDKDIDTDIPYAYMLGGKTYGLIESGKLFEYEQYFHVGRLPFAMDASLEDLIGYLRRVSECEATLDITSYYGQTNLPWSDESIVVCTPLRKDGIKSISQEFIGSYYTIENERADVVNNGLFCSLPVYKDNIDRFFDTKASFYYFNLHGSDTPTNTGFYADYVGAAIMPQQISKIENNNFFVSEACYGARFQQYRRHESMLLSAMSGKTLFYLGSSRIAFCNNRYTIDNSDRLVNIFIEELLNGVTAGEALFSARKSFFEYDNGHLYDQQLATIAEFNLFGDPTLSARREHKAHKNDSSRAIVSKSAVQRVCESKCLYDNEQSAHSGSIYEQVRMAVDSNLMKIRKVIDQELYAKLGVEPRSLQQIFRNRFADGREFYSFNYMEKGDDRDKLYNAIADGNGKIITVISTK